MCFACEERGATSGLEAPAAREVVELRKTEDPRQSEEHTEAGSACEVWERRKRSVLTCERGLHSALASGDDRLVRRWSRSLREAEDRLAWAEDDLARSEAREGSRHARRGA